VSPRKAPAAPPQAARPDVRRAPDWWALHPTLHLTIYPVRDHLRLTLVYKHQPKGAQVIPAVLLEADWAPEEVNEQKAVEWAQRALQAYLSTRLAEAGLTEAEPSE